jgi:ribosome-associated protein
MEGKENLLKAAEALYQKKAQDIVALDVSSLTVITDTMLIASGRNVLQVKTLADEVEDKMAEVGVPLLRRDGQRDSRWIVLDYGTLLVHLFHTQEREFYRLEKLWEHDGNRIPLPFDENEESSALH